MPGDAKQRLPRIGRAILTTSMRDGWLALASGVLFAVVASFPYWPPQPFSTYVAVMLSLAAAYVVVFIFRVIVFLQKEIPSENKDDS